MTANQISTICACCNISIPKDLKCSGCSSQLGREKNPITYYCGKDCQAAHWAVHKKCCQLYKTRQLLYRAGSLLQDVFYKYREATFDQYIVWKEIKDDTTFLYEGLYPEMTSVFNIFIHFPHKLFTTDEEKQALLAHSACKGAVGWMHDITKYLLKDITEEITEIETKTKNNKFQLKTVASNGQVDETDYPHSIYMIKLRYGGGLYALDLTGAQNGYHEPIVPFGEYTKNRAISVLGSQSFGSWKEKMMGARMNISRGSSVCMINAVTHKAMEFGVKEWEEHTGIDILSLFNLPEDKFRDGAKQMLTFIEIALKLQIGLMRAGVVTVMGAGGPMTRTINLG